MSKLRAFLDKNSDVLWPALCLFFCLLTILFAALKSIAVIDVKGSTGATITIAKNNMGVINVNGE